MTCNFGGDLLQGHCSEIWQQKSCFRWLAVNTFWLQTDVNTPYPGFIKVIYIYICTSLDCLIWDQLSLFISAYRSYSFKSAAAHNLINIVVIVRPVPRGRGARGASASPRTGPKEPHFG